MFASVPIWSKRLRAQVILAVCGCLLAGRAAASPCPGDCDISIGVTVDELVKGVGIALGAAPVTGCASMDQNNDGRVTVDELVMAVNRALGGCFEEYRDASVRIPPAVDDALKRLEDSLFDIPVANQPAVTGAGGTAGARTEGTCARGGDVEQTCAREGDLSRFGIKYLECEDDDLVVGNRVVLNGDVDLVIEDPDACRAGGITPGNDYEIRTNNFTRTVTLSGEQVLERRISKLTQRFVAGGQGCAGPNGTTWYDGTLDVVDNDQGISVLFTYEAVSVEVVSSGGSNDDPCLRRKTKSGTIHADDRAQNQRFTERTNNLSITEEALTGGARSVQLEGELDVDCLGSLSIETVRPLQLGSGVPCPRSGLLIVTLADKPMTGVRYSEGGVELDFGYVKDPNNCDPGESCGFVPDTDVLSCRDDDLAACHVDLPPDPARGFCDPEANSALRFDGMDDLVTFGAVPALSSFTVEAWVRPETGAQTGFVVGHAGGPDQSMSSGFGLDASAGEFCLRVDPLDPMRFCVEGEPDGAWHHLAGTFGGGEVRFYIDGVQRQQASGVSFAASNYVTAGAVVLSTGAQDFYTGEVDEVRIWNVVRSQAEIQAAMTVSLMGGEPGLVGYWQLDEGEGQTVADLSMSTEPGLRGTMKLEEDSDPHWVQSLAPECRVVVKEAPATITPMPTRTATLTIIAPTATQSGTGTPTRTTTPTSGPSNTSSPTPTLGPGEAQSLVFSFLNTTDPSLLVGVPPAPPYASQSAPFSVLNVALPIVLERSRVGPDPDRLPVSLSVPGEHALALTEWKTTSRRETSSNVQAVMARGSSLSNAPEEPQIDLITDERIRPTLAGGLKDTKSDDTYRGQSPWIKDGFVVTSDDAVETGFIVSW